MLAAGAIRFTPALPVTVQEAVDGLPMGVLNKVALRAAGADRFDLPDSCGVDQFVPAIDAPATSIVAWPHGMDHVICFIGGSPARQMEMEGATEAFIRGQLRALWGARADAALRPGGGGHGLGDRPLLTRRLRLCPAGLRWRSRRVGHAARRGSPGIRGRGGADGRAGRDGRWRLPGGRGRRPGLRRYSIRCRMIFWMSLVPS